MERVDLRLVPAAATSWAVTAAGIVWPAGPWVAVGFLGVAVVAVLVGRAGAVRLSTMRVLSTAVLAAALAGTCFALAVSLRTNAVRDHPVSDWFGRSGQVVVDPTESPRAIGAGRLLFRADLRSIEGIGMRGRVVVFASSSSFAEVTVGRPVGFRGRIAASARRDLTVAAINAVGQPSMGRASVVHRIATTVRDRLARQTREVLPPTQAVMLPALVLGDTSAVSATTAAEFRAAGLTHLTAVSGANVTIVCGAVLLLGRLWGPRPAVTLAAMALVAFVIVVEPTASVLRAAVMGAIALLAIVTSRRRQAIPALAATVLVLMIAAPQLAVDAGFALSVSATAALVCLAPVWTRRLCERGWPPLLAQAVGVAVAAQLVTAPLVAGMTGTVSLVAMLANVAVAAVIVPVTVLGTAAAVICPIWSDGAGLLIRFTGPELWWLLHVAQWTAALPNSTVPVPSGAGGMALTTMAVLVGIAGWPRRWFRCAVAVAMLGLIAWSITGLTVI